MSAALLTARHTSMTPWDADMMAQTRRKAKASPRTPDMLVPPTPERMLKTEGFFHRSATGPITVMDSPFERVHRRWAKENIHAADRLYGAGVKYRHHWRNAGQQERYATLNMSGVFGCSPEHITDAMSHHRSVYRGAVQHLGRQGSYVIEEICCRDVSLEDVGRKLGWNNKAQAIAASEALLMDALDRLATWWGVT